jgi:YVTN family beta-propeller protein
MANNKVYVVSQVDGGNGTVTIINGDTNDLLATVTVEKMPCAVAVNLTNNKVYVANRGSDKVTVIDGGTNIPISTITVGTTPWAIAVNTQTNKIYVVNSGSNNVTVIDGTTNIPDVNPVAVGTSPTTVAVNPNPGYNRIFVGNRGAGTVTVIDGATNNTITAVTVGTSPWAIAVDTLTKKVYVANYSSDNVTVIPEFYSVRITPAGTGTGVVDVNSSQGVISCGTTCSASFPVGQELVLFQTPTTNSGFSGWGGASCSGTGDCAFNMLTDKDVSADFTLSPLVKNQTTGVAYNSLQTAYNEAKDNHTIRARSTLTAAGLNLNQPTNLIIAGGYDADYTNCIGLTPVLGRVNVSFAPLHVHGLAIRPAP